MTVLEMTQLAGTRVVLVELMVTVTTILLQLETEGNTELEDEKVEIWLLLELDETTVVGDDEKLLATKVDERLDDDVAADELEEEELDAAAGTAAAHG